MKKAEVVIVSHKSDVRRLKDCNKSMAIVIDERDGDNNDSLRKAIKKKFSIVEIRATGDVDHDVRVARDAASEYSGGVVVIVITGSRPALARGESRKPECRRPRPCCRQS
jgi:hypothetical protein